MARSRTTVAAALLVFVAAGVMAATASAQVSSSEFDCNQSCITECLARKEEKDCPGTCKDVCVELEKVMARAAADKDCPLQCYESCMIQTKEGKEGCTARCKKTCNVTSDAEFAARLNPNSNSMK